MIEKYAKGEDSRKVTFDNCQNCTISVNFTIGGGGGAAGGSN